MASGQASPRIFLDSSVLFTAAVSSTGAGRELVRLGLRGRCVLLISNLVIQETRGNIRSKARHQLDTLESLLEAQLLTIGDEPSEELVLRLAGTVETKDAPIVAAALSAGADFLATYDQRHLLTQAALIRTEFGLAVISPGDLLGVLRQRT